MVRMTVTSLHQTSAGRMIFGRLDGTPAPPTRSPAAADGPARKGDTRVG
jgi:hypothetical protein